MLEDFYAQYRRLKNIWGFYIRQDP